MSKFALLKIDIGKVVGSIYTSSAVWLIDLDDVSPFSLGVVLVSFILFFTIVPLLIKYLPDKQSEKVSKSMPALLVALIFIDILIAVIFDR
ncbi:hypothetical protein ACI2LM_32825 [Paenibacillus lautus]|uniref:hypothetical protein n=1 Tax=Paenibacillus lautus TaxID=1401 RepID=UPI00384CCE55